MGGCHPRQSRLTGLTAFIVDPLLDVLGDPMDRRAINASPDAIII